jgi:hypothetical protein
VPPKQRFPDHRRVLARPEPPHRRVRRARPLRVLPRLRVERQHRARRRPQRGLRRRGPHRRPVLRAAGARLD